MTNETINARPRNTELYSGTRRRNIVGIWLMMLSLPIFVVIYCRYPYQTIIPPQLVLFAIFIVGAFLFFPTMFSAFYIWETTIRGIRKYDDEGDSADAQGTSWLPQQIRRLVITVLVNTTVMLLFVIRAAVSIGIAWYRE